VAGKKGFKALVIEKGVLGGTRLHHGSYAVRALHASASRFPALIRAKHR
jgi:pyruvate/2-oxoglutarate dehydrogenase complex dihydrolipoamide dehydrogenase (E3) component